MDLPARRIDVCNGDADGLCALVQLRLDEGGGGSDPVTGLKREVALLPRVAAGLHPGPGDRVTVLDVAVGANREALDAVLAAGARVRWFDHHDSGTLPTHPLLELHVDTASTACTSLLVNRHLAGRRRRWALAGIWGDNLDAAAAPLAAQAGLDEPQCRRLRALGEAINHNAYGDCEADVLIAPRLLFGRLAAHDDPLDFLRGDPLAGELLVRHAEDLARTDTLAPHAQGACGAVYLLPDAAWSRRVGGSLAHRLARQEPQRAHAVLRPQLRGDGDAPTWLVHVRAPLARPNGAARLCRLFGGNGRALAGGIDHLPDARVASFIDTFCHHDWG